MKTFSSEAQRAKNDPEQALKEKSQRFINEIESLNTQGQSLSPARYEHLIKNFKSLVSEFEQN